MEKLNIVTSSEPNDLLLALDSYQADIVKTFIEKTSGNYIECASRWVNSTPTNTALFGGEQGKSKIYIEKVLEEIEKFLCGDASYDEDRKKIAESTDNTQKYIIGVMSVAIGKVLGVAGTFIAPVIVLLLLSFGKIAVNAWCAMRRETRLPQNDKQNT